MQKKQALFVIIGLAVITALFVGSKNMRMNFMDRMIGVDYMETTSSVGEKMGRSAQYDSYSEPAVQPIYPVYSDDSLEVEERLQEKYAYQGVVVSDISQYMSGLKQYLSSIDAVVLNSSVDTSYKYKSASLTVKVPVDRFDEAVAKVSSDAQEVVSESISTSDVTGQVVNTQETVVSLQEQKTLKQAQLADATTQAEKARIQVEIDRLDRRIEQAQKAQEAVEQRVEYATLSITASDDRKFFNPGNPGDFAYEFEQAWESLKSFVKVLLVFGIWTVVYAVVWAPVVFVVSKVLRWVKG